MFYDPMISKLVTWGKDRKEAMDLIDKAFDEYVVHGVAHNIGFGKSIVNNEAFMKGDYSTAFIPKYYPDGYRGNSLNEKDMEILALACHNIKNINSGLYKKESERNDLHNKVVYVLIEGKGEEHDKEWKVEFNDKDYIITDLATGKSNSHKINSFAFEHNSLIKLGLEHGVETLQFIGSQNDLKFDFYY